MSGSLGLASSMYIMPPLPFSEGGKLASSQARASARKASEIGAAEISHEFVS